MSGTNGAIKMAIIAITTRPPVAASSSSSRSSPVSYFKALYLFMLRLHR